MAYKRTSKTSSTAVRYTKTHNLKTGNKTNSYSHKVGGSNPNYVRNTTSFSSDGSRRNITTVMRANGYIDKKVSTTTKSYKAVNKGLLASPSKAPRESRTKFKVPKASNFKNNYKPTKVYKEHKSECGVIATISEWIANVFTIALIGVASVGSLGALFGVGYVVYSILK